MDEVTLNNALDRAVTQQRVAPWAHGKSAPSSPAAGATLP
jgi:hypothetical protein